MTTYNTGNPVPSADARDRYDNSQVFDEYVTGSALTTADRLGVIRRTMRGQDSIFMEAVAGIGFESAYLTYGAGVVILRPTQLVLRSGVYYRITDAAEVPLTLTGDWAIDALKLTDVADASLRAALAAANGTGLIAFNPIGEASVATLQEKLADIWCIDDFKTGARTDIQAAEAMLSVTNGRLRAKENTRYDLDGWVYTRRSVVVRGGGMPEYNDTFTALQHGSVFEGNFEIRANHYEQSDIGVDCGTAAGFAHGKNGCTIDAPLGENGRRFQSTRFIILGSDTAAASTSHGFLVEGFDRGNSDIFYCANFWYGLIWKGRKAVINDVQAWQIGGTPLFIKSDLPASGGNVADATVSSVQVNGVISFARNGDSVSNAVHVMASTAVLASVQISNVQATFGRAAVTVAGGGASLYCVGVHLSNIKATGTTVGVELFGTTYDCTCDNLQVDNPISGQAFFTSGASSNWRFTETQLVLTDPSIVSTYAATMGGNGSWSGFSVRSGNGTKLIPFTPSLVKCGEYDGAVKIEGEGALALGGSWSSAAPALTLRIAPGNNARINGKVQNIVATGPNIAVAPAGALWPGDFLCTGYTSGGTATTCVVSWAANGAITLVTPSVATMLNGSIDLSSMQMQY